MGGLLSQMAVGSHARVDAVRADAGAIWAAARAAPTPLPPLAPEFVVIAEVKRRAPSVGDLAELGGDANALAADRAAVYAQAGAGLVSVLTEPERFAGALSHLAAAARALRPLGVPAMRKDFLVDPLQLAEARVAGAGAVLLIARMLSDAQLGECLAAAADLGLHVLLEAFDAADLDRSAVWAGPDVWLGVNTRDLVTLQVDGGRLARLVPHLPAGARVIAESGMNGPDDAAGAGALGYRGALVGTALMRSDNPGALVASLSAAGSAALAARG